jgi:hypothetical protein
MNPVRDPRGASAFLFGSAYFEATEVVIPPELLGFPAGTTRTWMSGVVNPAGRNYLERWALAVAEGDASFMSDGGNSCWNTAVFRLRRSLHVQMRPIR